MGRHARFSSSAHTVRAILAAIASRGGMPGIDRIVLNPVPEDVGRGADRIHALLAGGEFSEAALETSATTVALERRRGVSTFATWSLDAAAVAFLDEVAMELAPEAAPRAMEDDAPPVADRPAGPAAREADRPRARFRTTIAVIGELRSAGDDGIAGLLVLNADPEAADEEVDSVHIRLDDGTLSRSGLYCGPRSYSFWDGETFLDDLTLAAASETFIRQVRIEVGSASRPSFA